MIQCYVHLSSACRPHVCIVAKWCMLPKICLKKKIKNDLRNQMVTWPMMSCDPEWQMSWPQYAYSGISQKWLEVTLGSKGPPIRNGLWRIEWSRNPRRHVTMKGQGHDPNTLRAQYLVNRWRCFFRQQLIIISEAVWSAILATAWLLVLIQLQELPVRPHCMNARWNRCQDLNRRIE